MFTLELDSTSVFHSVCIRRRLTSASRNHFTVSTVCNLPRTHTGENIYPRIHRSEQNPCVCSSARLFIFCRQNPPPFVAHLCLREHAHWHTHAHHSCVWHYVIYWHFLDLFNFFHWIFHLPLSLSDRYLLVLLRKETPPQDTTNQDGWWKIWLQWLCPGATDCFTVSVATSKERGSQSITFALDRSTSSQSNSPTDGSAKVYGGANPFTEG